MVKGDTFMTDIVTGAHELRNTRLDTKGKYLTFSLGHEEYGLEILKVREIIGYLKVTAIPGTPAYVRGVINLRGQVIPVVDLRSRFRMEPTDVTDQTCIIVVETAADQRVSSTGIVVDRVQEVLDIASESIEPAPEFGSTANVRFILGIGKIGESVKILLDIDPVLNPVDLGTLDDSIPWPDQVHPAVAGPRTES